MTAPNIDVNTVESFADEWKRFRQDQISLAEARRIFADYFSIFPWEMLTPDSEGFDMGCGSGRWALIVAPRVGLLHCIDPSGALDVARQTLIGQPNVVFHQASVASSGLKSDSQDFGYCLGVLHHVPDTCAAIRSCAELLKPGAPLLLYLYYALDNRPLWFRSLWQLTNTLRRLICTLPPRPKQFVTDLIALCVYLPAARVAAILDKLGISVSSLPLSYYRNCSYYTMRTDSRDRFGTPLEQRFTQAQIRQMCTNAGLVNLRFSDHAPFWCLVGFKGTM